MAFYFKRNGGWGARISWYENGKRKTRSRQGFSTKMSTKKWAIEAEQKKNEGIDIRNNPSFLEYYSYWYETYQKPKMNSESRIRRYEKVKDTIADFYHDQKLSKVTRGDYQQFINRYGETHAPSTVRKLNTILRSCVESAIQDNILNGNFTRGVQLGGNKNKEYHVQYLSIAEIKTLIKITSEKLNPRYPSRFMIETAIFTGARLSEIAGLTWEDINFEKRTIRINKSWNYVEQTFKSTKNESSKRTIRINNQLLEWLQLLKKNHTNMVFQQPGGLVPTSNAVNKTLRSLMTEAGIEKEGFHFHSLRHAQVAMFLFNGVGLYAISRRLGHADTTTTSRVYAYLIDEYKEQSNDQIERVLDELLD